MLCKMYPPLTYYVKIDVKITVKKCLAFAIETMIFSGRRRHSTLKLNSNFGIIRPPILTFRHTGHKHMKLFITIAMKGIYLFYTVAWNYRKKIGFPVSKRKISLNFIGLQAYRKRGKSSRASPTPHHTLNEERRARFTTQPLSALLSRPWNGTAFVKKGPLRGQPFYLWAGEGG